MTPPPGVLSAARRALRRLVSSTDDIVSEELVADAVHAGAQPIASARVRERVVFKGVIAALVLNPRQTKRWLEADMSDGSGTIALVWIGRRTIPGIDVGRSVVVRGILTISEGRQVIFNPYYELQPGAA